MTDCALSNSTATDGGALYVDADGTLLMDSCVFYQNSAENGAGVYGNGGTLRTSGVTFMSNFASLVRTTIFDSILENYLISYDSNFGNSLV